MAQLAIHAEGLSKAYEIDRVQRSQPYKTLREELVAAVRRFVGPKTAAPRRETIWALKDVSFEIEHGQAVGIIGRNGAGKSTLLKILSRITEPTRGYADVFGRVGSLLEVMSKSEIRSRFDEIASFAEIERFLDTPVKRYSSGMYVRLAFAVAAHLQPEILLVDEVLAVGDSQFQEKCLGKMKDTTTAGRTVLFVSHNMAAVRHLCPVSIWVDQGTIRAFGPSAELIDAYLDESRRSAVAKQDLLPEDRGKDVQLRSVRLLDRTDEPSASFSCDYPFTIELLLSVHRRLPSLYGYLEILRADGTCVLVSDSTDTKRNPLDGLDVGEHVVRIPVPERSLAPGEYDVYLNFTSSSSFGGTTVDAPGIVASFRLEDITSLRGNRRHGFFSTLLPWCVAPAEPR